MGTIYRLEGTYEEPYPVQVKGESFYRYNFEKICAYYDEEEGYFADDHDAVLVFEDDSPHDIGNAIKIEIDGLKVGNLSRDDAKIYRENFTGLKLPADAVITCNASIKGGFVRSNGEVADFCVRLDFDLVEPRVYQVQQKPVEPIRSARISRAPVYAPALPVVKSPAKEKTSIWGIIIGFFLLLTACLGAQTIFEQKDLSGVIISLITVTGFILVGLFLLRRQIMFAVAYIWKMIAK